MKFLLCCGAEKAGTTWLYDFFRRHPQFYSLGKELNIIQRDDLVPCLENVSKYRANLDSFFYDVSKLNQVTGDFTHYEGSSENIFRLFKNGLKAQDIEIVPVYIMRDPIQRAWSAWHMLGGGDINMSAPGTFVLSNMLSCKYKETVEALDSVFPDPLYFFYESFFSQDNLDTITDRLGIQRQEGLFFPLNKGNYTSPPTPEFIKKFGKTRKNKEAVEFIAKRFNNVPWNLTDYT